MNGQFNVIGEPQFIIDGRYENLQLIPSGPRTRIYKANDTAVTNREVAIRLISDRSISNSDAYSDVNVKRAYRNFRIFWSVDHPNLIRLLNARISPNNAGIYLVTEYMHKNLTQYYAEQINHHQIASFIYDILCGVDYLHKHGIIHRDLKSRKIMVTFDGRLKITDFGLARQNPSNATRLELYSGYRYYRAPEQLFGMVCDEKADVWSVGCILAELLKRDFLFPQYKTLDAWKLIVQMRGRPGPEFTRQLNTPERKIAERYDFNPMPLHEFIPNKICLMSGMDPNSWASYERAIDLLENLLVIDPRQRYNVEQAMQHPYLRDYFNENDITPLRQQPFYDEPAGLTTNQLRDALYNGVQMFEQHTNNNGFI